MKYKIEELKDITDSREIMQSTPKGFSKYMTYIIIALLTLVIVWSIFAHKEISVKASGTVRPSNEVSTVSSSVMGNITSISIKDGDKVNEGDILLVVNGAEYVLQRDLLQKSRDKKNQELDALEIFKKSILDGKSYFDLNNEVQADYYKQYELFLNNLKSNSTQQELTDNQREEINKNISKLEQLKVGIGEGKNYFAEGDSFYYQYKDYEIALNNYNDIILTYETKITDLNKSITDLNKQEVEAEISKLNDSISSSKKEMDKYKNTTIMNITSKIADYKTSLSQLTISTASGSYKEQYVTNLESNITSMQSSISDVEMNLQTAIEKVNSTSIKAPCSGIINMTSNIKVGDYLQGGVQIASIVPKEDSKFNVEVYINNQNFGEIKEGQDVVIELASLPGSEYGYINSTLENISVDAKVSQKEGTSYYTATCSIDETSLQNKKGESINIKNGMLAQIRVVNREVSYFRYFLEKIDILD